ncbi:hypothetical protein CHLRE_17g739350v5 [Chlamydomonas reinhardtii]|uniref:Uncharacterized protein n=1 Tax=Chlamydomonas reinhardtii TaxID=3055 RepID=A0A2K3CRM0_CHLRE|nr:uncharacterized protein CHLRE_17g739350v5 [Chlamydomonas reinhardtii]PNW70927.1 hypothetical protein CHLRE_17g739350v5 [Chlamydomonas reinhardtii]
MARVYRSIITGLSLLLGLCVVCSVLLLEPKPFLHRWLPSISHGRGGCPLASSEKAFRSDSHLLGRLFSGPGLIQLTEGRESYEEVLTQLPQYRALVVVTAGRGTPTRRAEAQPYISLAATPTSPSTSPLAALALPLRLMNTGAAAVEAALGRRLYPITLDTFTRPAGAAGPYAVYDVSAGRLLLDAGMAAAVWGGGSSSVISGTSGTSGSSSTLPQTAFLTEQLASRVFGQLAADVAPRANAATAAATAGASATAATGGATAGGADGSRQPRRRLSQAAAGVGVDVVGDGDGGFLLSERNGDEDVEEEEREAAAYAGVAEPELGAAAGQAAGQGQGQGQGAAHAQLLGEGEEEGEEEGGAQQRAFEELDDGDVAAQESAAAAAATAMQQRQHVAHKVDTYVGQKQRRPDATADPAATAGGAGATAGESAANAADDAVETAEAEAEAADANSVDDRFTGRQSARLGATDAVVEDAEEEQQQQWDAAEGGVSGGAGTGASAAAAAAAAAVAAAVAAALPAAFSAAPPLWFCVLCPSVLGLVAPLAINMILNQVAGALCTQLHLTDDQCFDVLLGALAAGFVLSLASAIPIFFVCRLPECANRNVTAALRALRGAVPL